ncbi:MAG: ATP-binding cassette domain-containing protein [Fibrobacteres bacterium]|nr:ATP-binding cassette domain-containing protein [Fibrobacterota bacterium]
MSLNAIDVSNIFKSYDSLKAVDGLSFSVTAGSCFGLLGPNGAGKSTIMKILYGKASRDKNKDSAINVLGFDPSTDELSIKYLSGVVPQDNNLDEELNVEQNLLVFSKFYGMAASKAIPRINELLDLLELNEKRRVRIKELSGGMKRRLVIARALLNNPKLLFLDEPTTGLDPQVRHAIWDKLRFLKKQGMTILITTHYMEEAFQICDQLAILDKGKKVIEGNPQNLVNSMIEPYVLEIHSRSAYEKIKEFITGKSIRVDLQEENALCYAQTAQELQTLAAVLQAGECFLRQANLEDLFLRTTGRALNEHQ